MARLQDFSTVTPAGTNNLLIVQSQGQGLATINAVGQKIANDTTMSALNTTSKKIVGAINEVLSKFTATNVTSQITWTEDYANVRAIKKGGVLYLTYQGEGKTHANGDLIFTLPSGLRPFSNTFIPFTVNALAFGNLTITASNGQGKINQVSDSTASGRIYLSVAFPVE